MTKIYIDTNIFIDFYRASKNPISILDEIKKYSQYLITTSQTINEFHRNRILVLNKAIKDFQKSSNFQPFCTSLIQHLPEFNDLIKVCKEAEKKSLLIINKLEDAKKRELDSIAVKFDAMFLHPTTIEIPLSDQLIKKAHQRKLLGNPPTSNDKITIGDEIIWEALLSGVTEDLIIVTLDQTYRDNFEFLRTEFEKKNNKELLLITDKITDALKKVGEVPPPLLVEEENKIEEEEKCPKCGSRGQIGGFEGDEGDIANWFECFKCGYFENR